jgi:MOSC domain-containing protein YiiM
MTNDPSSLLSVRVGRVQVRGHEGASDPFDESWTTSIFKTAVDGPVFVRLTNLAGDEQADLVNHGGSDKAICVYSADHYDAWRATLGVTPFEYGAFGENFTIRRLLEDDVCIGDSWSVGGAILQVSQPRQPCWKLAQRWRIKDLADQVVKSGRTGWYFRVLREGPVQAGDVLALVERLHPEWTITAANGVMHQHKHDRVAAAALASIPALSRSWRGTLGRRILA